MGWHFVGSASRDPPQTSSLIEDQDPPRRHPPPRRPSRQRALLPFPPRAPPSLAFPGLLSVLLALRKVNSGCTRPKKQRRPLPTTRKSDMQPELVSFQGREMENVMRVSANTTIIGEPVRLPGWRRAGDSQHGVYVGVAQSASGTQKDAALSWAGAERRVQHCRAARGGDLARKKTFPALFGLFKNKFLPKNTQIVGYARSRLSNDDFVKQVTSNIKSLDENKPQLDEFLKKCSYVSGAYDNDESWALLNKKIQELEERSSVVHRVFYMALPPTVYSAVAAGLKKNCYSTKGSNRLVIEKPFGRDLESSRKLAVSIGSLWSEEEIYRIDHYLGKEMVKNIIIM
ncbi:MAG: glucose-6-phosphate dehydrogenase, partial [Olpidium bornovanus]